MARTAPTTRSTRSSTARASIPFEQPPTTTESGIAPGGALFDTPRDQPPAELQRSQRSRKATSRIATHRKEVSQSQNTSAKILRTKARNAKKKQQIKKKKRVSSPNLSDTDWDDDEDEDDEEDEDEDGSEDGSGEDGADGDDQDRAEDGDEYEPEIINRKDTDLDSGTTPERERLLKQLSNALDKDFSHRSTDELRSLWRAHRENQEAAANTEVHYPQITQLGSVEVAPPGGSRVEQTGPDQTERVAAKRSFDNSLAAASKRPRLSVNSQVNPSLIDPPSSNPGLIAPPVFRENAPSPTVPSTSQQRQPAPLQRFPTASTLVDNPEPEPEPGSPAAPLPPAPRVPVPAPTSRAPTPARAPTRASAPAQARVHAPTPAPACAPAPAPARAPAPAPARALAPAPARMSAPGPVRAAPGPAPRGSASAPVPRTVASTPARVSAPVPVPASTARTTTSGIRAQAAARPRTPVPAPAPAPTARASTSRSAAHPPAHAAGSTSDTRSGGGYRARASGGSRLPPVAEAAHTPAPHVPVPQASASQPPYTDLMDDRAEQIAEAEAASSGKPRRGRKQKRTAANYYGDDRMLIPHTVKRQFGLAITEGAYNNRGMMIDLSEEGYIDVFKILLPHKELRMPDEYYFPMIADRGATSRGEVRNLTRPFIPNGKFCDIIHPTLTTEDKKHNEREVNLVHERLFHYKVRDPPSEPYSNPELLRVFAATLFYSSSSVGVANRDLFRPVVPVPAIAFVLTNLEVCILEYRTGPHAPTNLNTSQQYAAYVGHARGLEAFGKRAPKRLLKLQEDLYKYAKAYARLPDTDDEEDLEDQLDDGWDDIRPDTPEPELPEGAEQELVDEPADEFAEPTTLPESPLWHEGPPPDWFHPTPFNESDDIPTDEYEQREREPEPESEPELEHYEDGRLTAHAKGKWRAQPEPESQSEPEPEPERRHRPRATRPRYAHVRSRR
ncbi:hypothetical protein FRC07_011918 [Ceratobasidium sp. 392]|nr:hypothetical protein FRC07_011918 [Ceratobasidium sp. 392]